jgi:hypothetical protein
MGPSLEKKADTASPLFICTIGKVGFDSFLEFLKGGAALIDQKLVLCLSLAKASKIGSTVKINTDKRRPHRFFGLISLSERLSDSIDIMAGRLAATENASLPRQSAFLVHFLYCSADCTREDVLLYREIETISKLRNQTATNRPFESQQQRDRSVSEAFHFYLLLSTLPPREAIPFSAQSCDVSAHCWRYCPPTDSSATDQMGRPIQALCGL